LPCWLAIVLAVPTVSGCGGGGNPKTYRVQGTIKLNGQPLPNASVTFVPVGGNGKQAVGTTDDAGSYMLGTYATGDGAVAGDYKVVVKYTEVPEVELAVDKDGKPDLKGMFTGFEKASRQKKKSVPKFVVPAKYGVPEKTDLFAKVPGNDTMDFDLKGSK
jgi:hypothetical protein